MPFVVFDCDGVLVESETILIACELEFLRKHGLDFDGQDYLHMFLGMAPKERERHCAKQALMRWCRLIATSI